MMPPATHACKSSLEMPKAGLTSLSACSKSAIVTCSESVETACLGLFRFSTCTCLPNANEAADLTRPSISAPEKFLVAPASSPRLTSAPRYLACFMPAVWMERIWNLPFSSGSEISTCTSRRPGRSRASSIMSLRLVMPMTRMLLSEWTPSIFESSWLTTVSCTPVPSRVEPRCLHTESISSKMMMCSSESSPFSCISASASAKSARMFSSDCPTYLERISGPCTTLGSFPLSILPICLAIRVLPVPGGP
mmetsp:Transcript_24931/g.53844  ORF Transcript_24931/g.53844 Transcript_24931/m.53844 type:complete len:250 (-) Transcript_24931:771-1520(-)